MSDPTREYVTDAYKSISDDPENERLREHYGAIIDELRSITDGHLL